MKSVYSGVGVVVIFFLSYTVPAFAQTGGNHQEDAAAIAKLTADYQAAYSRHDAKAAAALYAADGDRRTADGRVVKGRQAVERQLADDFAGRFKAATVAFDQASDIRYIGTSMAILDGSARLSGVVAPDGRPMPAARFFHTIVLVKHQGTWQMLALRNWAAPAQ